MTTSAPSPTGPGAKPRVLIVSKFFYRRGGAEVHAIELERELHAAGVPTAVFAMECRENILPASGLLFTAPAVSIGPGVAARVRFVRRMLGGAGLRRAFSRALHEFRPDVVHLHNIHSYLAPEVARMARSRGIRVVWTLHDYKLACPAYTMLSRGHKCDRCVGRSPLGVLAARCHKGSLAASAMAALEALRWRRKVIEPWVDAYVCPSPFMAAVMERAGFPPAGLHTIPNFITLPLTPLEELPDAAGRSGVCCVGRLSAEKGLPTLIEAARGHFPLTIAGSGPLEQQLRQQAAGCPDITFTGPLGPDQVRRLMEHSLVAVTPSEWNENCSLSIIEAACCGAYVVASDSGGNPALACGDLGATFTTGSVSALRSAVAAALSAATAGEPEARATAAVDADAPRHRAARARERFAAAPYLARLLPLYRGLKQLSQL